MEEQKIMTLTWAGREGGGGKLFVYHLESSPLVQSSARVAGEGGQVARW